MQVLFMSSLLNWAYVTLLIVCGTTNQSSLGCRELPLYFHQKLAGNQAHFTAGTQRDMALETIIPL